MTRFQANLCLLLAGAIWGGGFVAQSTAMRSIGPLWFIGLRFLIAAIVILPFAAIESRRIARKLTRNEMIAFTAIGAALAAGATTQQLGLLSTTVTNSGFLTGLYVIFVPILTVVVLRRAPHWIVWPGALLALAGIYLLSGGSLGALSAGDLLTVICAVFWSVQVFLIGILVPSSGRPLLVSAWQSAVTAGIALILAAIIEPIHLSGLEDAAVEILYAGIFSSGLAFSLQIIGQRYTTAPQAAIFLSSEALFAAFFGAIILGETITASGYAGCALIFAAMLMVELVPELWKKRAITAV